MEVIKILLVDDQILFAESLKGVLSKAACDLEIIGIASNGREAIQLVEKEKPDVILMDVRMPKLDGVQATKIIHQRYPEIQIIMLTTFDDDDYVRDALHYGAISYLLKENIMPEDLIAAIRLVKKGSFMMSPSIAEKIIEKSYYFDISSREERSEVLNNLNTQEKKILKLITQGFDNVEIADQLNLANQTIKNYVSSIYTILGVHSRAQAIKIGIELLQTQKTLSEEPQD